MDKIQELTSKLYSEGIEKEKKKPKNHQRSQGLKQSDY